MHDDDNGYDYGELVMTSDGNAITGDDYDHDQ